MELIRRKDALDQGLTYYFTGKPCKKGHVALRRAINGCCVECEMQKNNDSTRKEYMRQYAEQNRNKLRETASRWQKNNKGKVNANTAERHTAKMQRKPKWLTKEDKQVIKSLYELAAIYKKECGIDCHVDHVVPLQGKTVSGLHVPWNLQILPAVDNIKKSNRFNDNH